MDKQQKMLIVEDDRALSLVLSKYYGRNYDVQTVFNANECQEIIRRFKPDVVLLDYFLPGKTGGELFQIIKKACPNALIIILSANDSSQTVVDLIKLGVRDYVIKGTTAIEEIDEILKNVESN